MLATSPTNPGKYKLGLVIFGAAKVLICRFACIARCKQSRGRLYLQAWSQRKSKSGLKRYARGTPRSPSPAR